ncbi:MAG TPA: ABC transporter ATP-binding protein [Pirellulales bacterium]|nr:ABC transporter ATP-binding protein [Pirellulales bacterium]
MPSNWQLVRRLLGLAWRYRRRSLLVLIQQALLVALSLAALSVTGVGIDALRHWVERQSDPPRWPFALQPPPAWSPIAVTALLATAILGLASLHALLRYIASVSAGRLVQDVVVDLRSEVYDKLQRLSFRYFDRHRSGSIINRVAGDVQAVRMFIDGVVVQTLSVLLCLAVYLYYMLRLHVGLTLAALATTPLLWLAAVLFSRRVRPAYQHASELTDDLVLKLSETVQGIHVIKGFAREPEQTARFASANRAIETQKEGIFRQIGLFQPAMGFLTQINMIVLLSYGGWLVIEGRLPLGAGLFVFANLLQQFANQVGQITNIANSIQASLTGAQRVFEILDAPLEVANRPDAKRLKKVAGRIEFDAIEFAYTAGSPVLEKINLTIEPGQVVALVGATGSGKTSLLNLVPRFYDPTAGCVRVDGRDLRTIDLNDLRRNVGIVFQETFLFSNTVAANIAFGHPQATQAEIERAARLAAAHEFIVSLPHGYDTVVGEYGSNLSGGQRQRLALARALLLDPAILIFDDATSAVDRHTEEEILSAIEQAMRGRTTLVAAHRLSTLRRADLIVVLDEGRMVQTGTHDELLRLPGPYYRAAQLQLADAEPLAEFQQAEFKQEVA